MNCSQYHLSFICRVLHFKQKSAKTDYCNMRRVVGAWKGRIWNWQQCSWVSCALQVLWCFVRFYTKGETRRNEGGVSSLLQAQIINQTLREEKTVIEDGGGDKHPPPHLNPSILLSLKKSPWDCTNAGYVFWPTKAVQQTALGLLRELTKQLPLSVLLPLIDLLSLTH